MPIPLLVAGIAVLVSGAGAGGGVVLYKNNKYNKAQKAWQDEKHALQERLIEYQTQLRKREERILELQQKLTERTKQLEETTKKLYETDHMIELLEQRHKELESFIRKFIAIILFRYGKHRDELNGIVGKIAQNQDEKNRILAFIAQTKEKIPIIQTEIEKETKEEKYYESEINTINEKLNKQEA
jgi:septal ring factor EnvC (AmiA/AmiB activator)